jgi:hypothetical protein
MSSALLQNAELLKQNRDAVFRRAASAFVNTPAASTAQIGTLSAGARVFDSVTGEEGEVIHATRHNVVVRPTN